MLTIVVAGVLLGGCSDAALVDRVAEMERSQDQLRVSLRELGAPDPEATAAQEALVADVAGLSDQLASVTDRLTTLGTAVEELRAEVTAGALADDERLTAVDVRLGELASTITAVQGAVATVEERLGTVSGSVDELTDRTTSLDVQLDAHVDDPGAHAGAPGSQ